MSERGLKPLIIPIFIPNQGCPHQCIFCEQERITSQPTQPIDRKYVEDILHKAIHSNGFDRQRKPEVAFYGGTFTGLPLVQIKGLLEAVVPYVRQGLFQSIRVSTRPDALDQERLEVMKNNGVLTVELGAQSMDDHVLGLSKRGHTALDTAKAVKVLREHGFKVGVQLMPGLPGDSRERFRSTIKQVIALHPAMVRLYPALVIRGTELADWYRKDKFHPLALEQAIEICVESCSGLEAEGIPVIRIGLMSSPSLLEEGQIVAGPWHPAFGFLVRSRIYQKKIEPDLPRPGEASQIKIRASKGDIPLLRGFKNQGLKWLEKKTASRIMGVEYDDSIPPGRVKIEKV